MKNSASFYLQFVHYSNNDIQELKSLIKDKLPLSVCHLVSNSSLSKLFKFNNLIGRFLYISTSTNILSMMETLNVLPIIKNKFNQLNLFYIRINYLFITHTIFLRFIKKLDFYKNKMDSFHLILSNNYVLNWLRLSTYHTKYNYFIKFLYFNNTIFRKFYTLSYI